jgi:hypothetical protein
MQTTLVNAPNKNFSLLPAGRYGKSTKRSTQQRHQANDGKSSLEIERIRALGAFRSLRSKKKLAAEKRSEPQSLSNEYREKCIQDYVERVTAGQESELKTQKERFCKSRTICRMLKLRD